MDKILFGTGLELFWLHVVLNWRGTDEGAAFLRRQIAETEWPAHVAILDEEYQEWRPRLVAAAKKMLSPPYFVTP